MSDGLTTAGTPCCEPAGAATHTPVKWVATVPSGQSALAGAATASDPRPRVSAQPPTRRFRTIGPTLAVGAEHSQGVSWEAAQSTSVMSFFSASA